MHSIIHHRPGDAERRRIRFRAGYLQEIGDDFFQALVPTAGITFVDNLCKSVLLDVEKPEVGLRSADVAGKYYVPATGAFLIYLVMIVLLMLRPTGIFGRR